MKYNNDDLLQELKNEFDSIKVPNLSSVIKARYLIETKERKKSNRFKLSYLIKPLMGVLTIFVLVLIILIYNNSTNPPVDLPLNEKNHQEVNFRSLSAINLISSDTTLQSTRKNLITDDEEIDDIHKYILLVEQSLNADIISKSYKSDKKEYDYKEIITMTSPFGQKYEYIFYFNLHLIEDDEDEQEYEIEGIMYFEDTEFYLTGKHEVEEQEYETYIYAYLNENNWVKVKQEIEDNEASYHYEIYQNGKKTVVKLEIENDEEEAEIKLTIEDGLNKTKYEFKKEISNNQTNIKIKTKNQNINLCVVFDEKNNPVYEYFLPNSNKKIQRGPKHKSPMMPHGPMGPMNPKNKFTNF